MSKGAVNQVIQRAIGDAAFRRQLQSDPKKALAGFDLTKDERAAITSGDPTKLMSLGVDQRMSKAFSVPLGDASKSSVTPDVSSATAANFIDEGSAGGQGSSLTDGGQSVNSANLRRIEGDLNVAGAVTEGSGSALRDAHDTISGRAGSTARAEDAGSINATNLRRIEGDLNTGAAQATPQSGAGDFNAFDPGMESGSSSAAVEGGSSLNAMNLRRIEGDLNTGAAVTEGSGSAIRDSHDTLNTSEGSALRDAHDASAYAAKVAGDPGPSYPSHFGLAGPSTAGGSVRDTHDSSAYAAKADDASSINATNLRRIEGDLNVGSASATPQSGAGDFNAFDPGLISGNYPAAHEVDRLGEGAQSTPDMENFSSGTAFENTTSPDLQRLDDWGKTGDAARATDADATPNTTADGNTVTEQ